MKRFAHLANLHPISRLAFVVSTAAMTLIVVPGLITPDRPQLSFPSVVERHSSQGTISSGPPEYTREFEHGWPCTYMRRAVGYSIRGNHPLWPKLAPAKGSTLFIDSPLGGATIAGYEVAWTASIAWPFAGSDLSEFYLIAAIVDACVAVAIVVLTTASCEIWLRRRGSLLRWRIIDFIAILTILAFALGYWKQASVNYQHDAQAMKSLFGANQSLRIIYWKFRGPDWLARLIGTRKPLDNFELVVNLYSASADGSPESWRIIGTLSGLERLEISKNFPTEADFAHVINLPRLRSVSWGDISPKSAAWLPKLSQVERMVLYQCDLPDAAIARLRQQMPGVVIEVRRH